MTALLLALALMCEDVRTPHRGVAIIGGTFAVTWVFLRLGRLSVLATCLILGATAWWGISGWRTRREHARARAGEAAYLGAACAELRAGATVPAALANAAQSLPARTPPRLSATARMAAHVAAVQGDITHVLREGDLPQLGALVELGTTYGMPLADLFAQAQQRVDDSRSHAARTAASLQGPQSTALVLTCLPLVGIALGQAMGAAPLTLLTSGGWGGALLVAGTALACVGFAWSQLIISRASTRGQGAARTKGRIS